MMTEAEEKKKLVDAIEKGLRITKIVGDAIHDLGEVPSGHLYALLVGHMSFDAYTKIINILKRTGAIEEKNHLLKWIKKTS